jgi:hypothetical protein
MFHEDLRKWMQFKEGKRKGANNTFLYCERCFARSDAEMRHLRKFYFIKIALP